MVSRVGSLSVFTNTFRNLAGVQADLADLQRQISSQQKAENFEQLNGQVEQFTFLESRLRQTERFVENNQIVLSRLGTADVALTQAIELVDQAENLLVQRRNPALGQDLNFGQQLRDLVRSVATEVNVVFEGRALFGGTNTSSVPVPDPFAAQTELGVPDDGYYQGANSDVTYRADERVEFVFPVRADDPAFQKFFAAANLALKADAANDDEQLVQALDLLQESQDDLNAARARVNSNTVVLTQINERHTSTVTYLTGVTQEVGRADLLTASIEVANNEAILQAGFQALVRVTQLRLSDFL